MSRGALGAEGDPPPPLPPPPRTKWTRRVPHPRTNRTRRVPHPVLIGHAFPARPTSAALGRPR